MRFILIAVLAALLGAPRALAADEAKSPVTGAAAPAAQPFKIGYVDFSRVWTGYRRSIDLHNDLKALSQALTNQGRARTEEIARYDREIEKLAMGTPERLELEDKARAASKEMEEFQRKARLELNEKFVAMLNGIVAEMSREIAEIAKEEGYALVIKEQTPDPNIATRDDALIELGQRVVLYAKPEYDLTSAVLKRLNDKYDAEQKKNKEAAPESPKQPETPTQEK